MIQQILEKRRTNYQKIVVQKQQQQQSENERTRQSISAN